MLPVTVQQASAPVNSRSHRGDTDEGCCPNVGDLQGILDPLVLALMLGVCLASIAVGFYQLFVTGARRAQLPAAAGCWLLALMRASSCLPPVRQPGPSGGSACARACARASPAHLNCPPPPPPPQATSPACTSW